MHAATGSLPPAESPADAYFDAATRWVERRVGDTGVFDEDLALAYLATRASARSARSASPARSRSTPTRATTSTTTG